MASNESKEYSIDRPSGLLQSFSRQRIMEVLLSENILVGIQTDHNGRMELITHTWEEYRRRLSFLSYEATDYLEWIENKLPVNGEVDFDFTLLCRLLNNASIFTIESTGNWELIKTLGGSYPVRLFNLNALLFASKSSILEKYVLLAS